MIIFSDRNWDFMVGLIKLIMKTLLLILLMLSLNSCSEIKTNNPKETYKYWSGVDAPSDLELLNGQYWQSSHWTKEYIMYLEFKPSEKWWKEFIKQNNILIDKGDWAMPSDVPKWFKPSENSIRFRALSDFDKGSRFFKDTLTNVCYIYEIQL